MMFKSKVDSGEVDVEVVEVKRGGLPLNESKRKRYMALYQCRNYSMTDGRPIVYVHYPFTLQLLSELCNTILTHNIKSYEWK